MEDTGKRFIEMTDLDSFFGDVYTCADAMNKEEVPNADFYKDHPKVIMNELKQFIFHSDDYKNLDDKMQQVIQGCILYISKH